MNFFEHQDEARRSTRKLVLLFCIAVFLLIVLTNLVVIGSLWLFDASIFQKQQAQLQSLEDFRQHPELIQSLWQYFDLKRIVSISFGIVLIIATVIFFKRLELSGGGKVIAERLGGKLLSLETQDTHEKVILNVVEEMAIASGMPVPPVYLLPEVSINAFAAGFNTNDAVIGVSKGAVQNLNRDQLQGVIAHEFSHILNGDMRLNINLIAVLSGILFIGQSGWFMVRFFGGTRSRRSSRDSGSAIAVVGLLFVVVGYIGTFFGKLIKAAVSRQREFLADASAVQFTRNPEGISGALKLIGGSRFGSVLHAPHTEEMSHLFFSQAIKHSVNTSLSQLFSTHPPLEERIIRIEPNWDGMYLKMADEDNVAKDTSSSEKLTQTEKLAGATAAVATAMVLGENRRVVDTESVLKTQTGETSDYKLDRAHTSLASLNYTLRDYAHKKKTAALVVFGLLTSVEEELRVQQKGLIKTNSFYHPETFEEISELLKNLDRQERLNLVEILVPALKQASFQEYQEFLDTLVALIKSDGKVELFEWILHSILVFYLKPQHHQVKPIRPKYRSFKNLKKECQVLMSYLVGLRTPDDNQDEAFNKSLAFLDLKNLKILPIQQLDLNMLNSAIIHFKHLFPLLKPKLLKACVACVESDGVISLDELELIRALAILLDCPMPLLTTK